MVEEEEEEEEIYLFNIVCGDTNSAIVGALMFAHRLFEIYFTLENYPLFVYYINYGKIFYLLHSSN